MSVKDTLGLKKRNVKYLINTLKNIGNRLKRLHFGCIGLIKLLKLITRLSFYFLKCGY